MAAPFLVIKRGDTYPPVESTLKATVGTEFLPLDLTPAVGGSGKINFIMKRQGPGVILPLIEICTYPEPSTGKVIYKWKAGETETVGVYQVEWEIHWSAGGIQSVPNGEYDTIEIISDLG